MAARIDIREALDVFEGRLARLPTLHGPPDGAILLATADGRPAGCVMLRKFEGDMPSPQRPDKVVLTSTSFSPARARGQIS